MRRYINFRLFAWSLALLLFWAVILVPAPSRLLAGTTSASAPGIIVRSDAETFYLAKINQLRAAKGLAPLIVDSRLSLSASQKTSDMISQHYWSHYAPNGTAFSDYIWRDSPKADRVGENLAKCFDTQQEAFDALVASPTHYAIMVGQFTNFGVYEAVDSGSGCTYTTMHFTYYN